MTLSLKMSSDAALDPVLAERDARRAIARVQRRRADVTRLLEERDARLRPEALAEQRGRVRADRQRRREQELRDVVGVAEAVRLGDLEVDLKARVAGLEHERVVLGDELVEALDRDVVAVAARRVITRFSVR